MKSRYLEAIGEIENMLYFAERSIDNQQVADEVGITTKQAAYMAEALRDALDALETGADDADLVPVKE